MNATRVLADDSKAERGTAQEIEIFLRTSTGTVGYMDSTGTFMPISQTGEIISNLTGAIVAAVDRLHMTVTPAGGSGSGYTYVWSFVSSDHTQSISAGGTTATVTIADSTAPSTAMYKVRITDSVGNVEDVYYSLTTIGG